MILLTGFESGDDVPSNPTSELVEQLVRNEVVGEVLPVSFRRAGERLEKLIRELRPEAVLNLGLAPERPVIRVERIAINLIDARIPDNDGEQPVDVPIDPDGPPCYFSTLPTREIVGALRGEGIPAFLSYSAGTYLCNYVMYKTLRTLDIVGLRVPAGFIHIPYSSEMASKMDKPVPSLPLSTIKRAIQIALDVITSSSRA
ncbi:MAG: pyroglutamyl-peptidase I [Candidatus Korarchaeota archaeon]|nr:pyroglutamyl-peptidase I [Candidatus Korarchaeota archaeon]